MTSTLRAHTPTWLVSEYEEQWRPSPCDCNLLSFPLHASLHPLGFWGLSVLWLLFCWKHLTEAENQFLIFHMKRTLLLVLFFTLNWFQIKRIIATLSCHLGTCLSFRQRSIYVLLFNIHLLAGTDANHSSTSCKDSNSDDLKRTISVKPWASEEYPKASIKKGGSVSSATLCNLLHWKKMQLFLLYFTCAAFWCLTIL